MSDETAVYAACRVAQDEGREIDHGTARTIGSWYAQGMDETQSFATTGAIINTATTLWRRMTDNGNLYSTASEDDKLALDMIGTYLLNREDTGPVPGWHHMWCR
jgi:hypothetical protein